VVLVRRRAGHLSGAARALAERLGDLGKTVRERARRPGRGKAK
jgi:hypothetical protein